MKPHIPVTLLCVDCTDKAHLAQWAVERCMDQADFAAVKFLTHEPRAPYAVRIPRITSIDGYSQFMVCEAYKHVTTSHALIVQSDGYLLNAEAWTPRFLDYDYIGAPWWHTRVVGNGGFSLRSAKLMRLGARYAGRGAHPEDAFYCYAQRKEFETLGIRYADLATASRFAIEGRTWEKKDWVAAPNRWEGQLGFHSWLTPLPATVERPTIFHHSGDSGDVIYALATMKAMGGGVLFLSPDNRHPYPAPTRERATYHWTANLAGLIGQQDYVWRVQYTERMPYSVDVDFNEFRLKYYKHPCPENFQSLFRLHLKAFGADYPEDKPWLTVDRATPVPDRPIVVNRTTRYHNEIFPWRKLVKEHQDKMVFIGSEQEYAVFCGLGGRVPYMKTPTLLDVARVVAGAKVFIGNQSCPMAIALGLGKNAICEGWLANPNTNLKRPNLMFIEHSNAVIPEEWLQ